MNENKKVLGKVGAILAIVLYSLLAIGSYSLIAQIDNEGAIAVFIIALILAVAAVISASLLISNYGKGKKTGKHEIFLSIFGFVYGILEIASGEVLMGLIFLCDGGLLLAAFVIKSDSETGNNKIDSFSSNESIFEKDAYSNKVEDEIRRLKELKETGILTEEQYKAAVSRVIEKL